MNEPQIEAECRECGRRSRRATLKGLCYERSRDCPHAEVVVGRVRLTSGAVQVKKRCLRCGNMLGNLPSAEFVLDNLPWLYEPAESHALAAAKRTASSFTTGRRERGLVCAHAASPSASTIGG
jgi:hypothetical protein